MLSSFISIQKTPGSRYEFHSPQKSRRLYKIIASNFWMIKIPGPPQKNIGTSLVKFPFPIFFEGSIYLDFQGGFRSGWNTSEAPNLACFTHWRPRCPMVFWRPVTIGISPLAHHNIMTPPYKHELQPGLFGVHIRVIVPYTRCMKIFS